MKIEKFEKKVKQWINNHIVLNDINKECYFSLMVSACNNDKEITIIRHVDTVPSLTEEDLFARGRTYKDVYKKILQNLEDKS